LLLSECPINPEAEVPATKKAGDETPTKRIKALNEMDTQELIKVHPMIKFDQF
jgi:hypothetical protein